MRVNGLRASIFREFVVDPFECVSKTANIPKTDFILPHTRSIILIQIKIYALVTVQ